MGVQRLKPSGGATIKSIQRGTVAISGAVASGTATITSVDVARAELRDLGYSNPSVGGTFYAGYILSRLALTNSTTVTATRGAATTGFDVTHSFEVTEWQQ